MEARNAIMAVRRAGFTISLGVGPQCQTNRQPIFAPKGQAYPQPEESVGMLCNRTFVGTRGPQERSLPLAGNHRRCRPYLCSLSKVPL